MVGKAPRLPTSMGELEKEGMSEFCWEFPKAPQKAVDLYNARLREVLSLRFTDKMRSAFNTCMVRSSRQYNEISENANPSLDSVRAVFHSIFSSFLRDMINIAEHLSNLEWTPREEWLFSQCGLYIQIHDESLAQYSYTIDLLMDTFMKMKEETPQGHTVHRLHDISVDLKNHPYPQPLYPEDSEYIHHPLYLLDDKQLWKKPDEMASIYFYARHPYSATNDRRKEPNEYSKLFAELAQMYFVQITTQFETHVKRTWINRANTVPVDFPKK